MLPNFRIPMTERSHRRLYAMTGNVLIISGVGLILLLPYYLLKGASILTSVELVGHYAIAFSGCLLVAWGSILVSVAPNAAFRRQLAGPIALGFALCALMRILVIPSSDELVGAIAFLADRIPAPVVPIAESVVLLALTVIFGIGRASVQTTGA